MTWRTLGISTVVLFGATVVVSVYLWNSTRTLIKETRNYPLNLSRTRQVSFAIQTHSFRPITEFRFSSESADRKTSDDYVVGAYTTDTIRRVEWLPQVPVVLLTLGVKLDSEPIVKMFTLLYDFDRSCFVVPNQGQTTQNQVDELLQAFENWELIGRTTRVPV